MRAVLLVATACLVLPAPAAAQVLPTEGARIPVGTAITGPCMSTGVSPAGLTGSLPPGSVHEHRQVGTRFVGAGGGSYAGVLAVGPWNSPPCVTYTFVGGYQENVPIVLPPGPWTMEIELRVTRWACVDPPVISGVCHFGYSAEWEGTQTSYVEEVHFEIAGDAPPADSQPVVPAGKTAEDIQSYRETAWKLQALAIACDVGQFFALRYATRLGAFPPTLHLAAAMTGLGLALQIGKWIIQAGALMSALKAADPPDANYRAIARPVDPAIPRVGTGRRRLDAALRRLIRAGVDATRYGRATLTAVERMQGAMADGERGWAARQIGAASRYTSKEAAALRRLARSLPRLGRALPRAARLRLTRAQARRMASRPDARMTRPTRRLLRRLGFDPRDLKRRPSDTGEARVPTGRLDRVLRRPAIRRDLRAAAARLDQISVDMAQQRDALEASA